MKSEFLFAVSLSGSFTALFCGIMDYQLQYALMICHAAYFLGYGLRNYVCENFHTPDFIDKMMEESWDNLKVKIEADQILKEDN